MKSRKVKKTNVADTSIEAYHQVKRNGLIENEKAKALSIMKENEPLTCRGLSLLSGIEKTNCTRILYDLEREEKVKIAFKGKCKHTNMTVRYYEIIEASEDNKAA